MGTPLSTADWSRYASTRDPQLRARIIIQYSPLVKYVIGRLAINVPTILDAEDILSYGVIGLIDAIERFDPTRGIKFETYAIARTRGAIIDGLRALDHIPRTARQKAKEIELAMTQLEATLERPPTDFEIAAYLHISLPHYLEFCQRVSMKTTSLDTLLDLEDESDLSSKAGSLEDANSPNPESLAETQELNDSISEALRLLPDRERLVLAMYYNDELTMREISCVLGISESRVCQLHSQAVLRLRTTLRAQQLVA